MFSTADAMRKSAAGSKVGVSAAAELDYGLHLYLGMMAIIALDGKIDVSDLSRIKGYDSVMLMKVGRGFFIRTSGEASSPSDSDEQSETTAAHSTPPAEMSNEDA